MEITLFRGITLKPEDASEVKDHIQAHGIQNGQGKTWQFECINLRAKLDQLLEKPDLSTEDTRPSRRIETPNGFRTELVDGYPAVCACADHLGASYYAMKHNYNLNNDFIHGLIITIRADITDLQIDGRDFLYNAVFRDARTSEQRDLACKIFGNRLGLYLDRAMGNPDTSYKFAMCDLAVQDLEIIEAHAKNEIVLGGRCGTVFKSAFFVKTPVTARNIISVDDAQYDTFNPQVTCDSFRQLGE